jgi:hypothetical protein
MLLEPVHQSSIYLTPEFEWVDVHDSTTNGKVVGYILITDTDPLFKTPDRAAEVQTNTVTILGLHFGVHYWKVLTLYEKPEGSTSPLSPHRLVQLLQRATPLPDPRAHRCEGEGAHPGQPGVAHH